LLAFGSANPRTEEQYHTGSFTTYYGKTQAIIKAGETGMVEINVEGDGVQKAMKAIEIH
jgi:hypothetical protein